VADHVPFRTLDDLFVVICPAPSPRASAAICAHESCVLELGIMDGCSQHLNRLLVVELECEQCLLGIFTKQWGVKKRDGVYIFNFVTSLVAAHTDAIA